MSRFSTERGYGRAISRYLNFVARKKGLILILYIICMGFLAYKSTSIKLDSNLYSLFPQKLDSLQYLQKMQDYYGGSGDLTLSVRIPHQDDLLSALLPRYIDENRQTYIRELEQVYDNTQDEVSKEDILAVNDTVRSYFQRMNKYYIPGLVQEMGKGPKKYTELFVREYREIIIPDIKSKEGALHQAPTKENLDLLIGSFKDNVSVAEMYLEKIGQSLPKDRQILLQDFTRRFAKQLQDSQEVVFVDYFFDQKFVEDHLLYFLDLSDITYIQDQLQGRINYERRKSLLSSFLFVDSNETDLQFQYLRNKYTRTRGEGVSRKFIRLQNPNTVFDGSSHGAENQFYLSSAKDASILKVRPRRGTIDIDYAVKILNFVEQTFEKTRAENSDFNALVLTPTGQYVDRKEDARLLGADLTRITPIAMGLVFLTIILYFRSLIAIVIVCLPLFSDIMCALGFVSVTYGYLNLVSSFLVAIIGGLGVNMGTHLLARYVEAKDRGKSPIEGLYEVFTTVFLSNVTATLTTAVGFFVLAISSFKGFREFGIIAGIGMITLIFGVIVIFPTIILWLESHKLFRIKLRKKGAIQRFRGRPFPMFKLFCFLGLGFAIYSLFALDDIDFNANFTSLVRKSNSAPTLTDYYGASAAQILQLSGNSGVVSIYTPNKEVYQELTQELLTGRFANENFRVESLYIYDAPDQSEKQKAILELSQTLQSGLLNANNNEEIQQRIDFLKKIAKSKPTTWDTIPESLRGAFLGIKPGYFILYYPMAMPKSISTINNYYHDFQRIEREYSDRGVLLASDIWIFGDLIRVIEKESVLLFIAIMVLFVLLLWVDFRSIKLVIAGLFPLIIGFLFMVGLCVLFKIEWNFFNVLMFPVIAGLGIDYGVHMMHRMKEEGEGNLLFVFCSTGKIMWVAAFEDSIGFGMLVIAMYYGLVTTGQILIVGVFGCLVSGSILLPAIAQWREDIRARGLKQSFLSWDGYLPVNLFKSRQKNDAKID